MDKLTGPNNRVGGDFNADAVEAFRNAYAQILNAPDDDSVANESGLPTNTVANTSPWHEHLPLWKYPSGKGPEEDLRAPFNPNDYMGKGEEEENAPLTDDEIDQIVSELLDGEEEEDG
jgi:hypothetical protein